MPKAWAMTDVYGLDDGLLDMIPQPVAALMLLFPINEKVGNLLWHKGKFFRPFRKIAMNLIEFILRI